MSNSEQGTFNVQGEGRGREKSEWVWACGGVGVAAAIRLSTLRPSTFRPLDASRIQIAPCSLRHALCAMLSAPCSLRSALCSMHSHTPQGGATEGNAADDILMVDQGGQVCLTLRVPDIIICLHISNDEF